MEMMQVPSEKAHEPEESARQPSNSGTMSPPRGRGRAQGARKLNITFAESTSETEVSSQNSSQYKEVLSQPAANISHRQKMMWLQKRRRVGLWAQCDRCERWRHLPHVLDSHELPAQWYCDLNPDRKFASCSVPESPLLAHDEEDLIHAEYGCGSLVWARLAGWGWWPALVDDCPDVEQFYWLDGFSDIPTSYNVVFFDKHEATRAWIAPENLKPYGPNKTEMTRLAKESKYRKRLEFAITQAEDAEMLPLEHRLSKYSFITRYNGEIRSPKKVNKNDLKKYQKKLKRKFGIEFPIEDSDDSENDNVAIEKCNSNSNVILVGTPKSKRLRNKQKRKDLSTDSQNKDVTAESKDIDSNNIAENSPVLHTKNDKEKKVGFANKNTPLNGEKTTMVKGNAKRVKLNDYLLGTNTTEISTLDVFKEPPVSSMVVQIDSEVTNFTNDDSSKTYLPECEKDVAATQSTWTDINLRPASPSSDDFDF